MAVGHCRDILRMTTAGIILQLGIAGILCGWALLGYLVVEHCRDTLRLGSIRIFCGWDLQGYSANGHCRDIWWLGIAGIFGGGH